MVHVPLAGNMPNVFVLLTNMNEAYTFASVHFLKLVLYFLCAAFPSRFCRSPKLLTARILLYSSECMDKQINSCQNLLYIFFFNCFALNWPQTLSAALKTGP